MVNLSHTDAKREKIDNGTPLPLSRDFERLQLFSYIKSEDQIFHLQVMKKNTDSLAGASWDATPLVSEIDFLNLHMDYGIDFTENWHAMLSYDWAKINIKEEDELPLIGFPRSNRLYARTENSTFTGEITYKKTFGKHHINAGIKGRDKQLDSVKLDGRKVPSPSFDSEKIASVFFQDQYALTEQQLLSLGVSYNYINRNGGIENDSLLQLRLGYIYTSETWSYKTYLYRTQVAIEPLMRYFYPQNTERIEAQTTLGITQEVAYTNEKQQVRLILQLMRDEDSLLQNTYGNQSDTKYFTSVLNYSYDFDKDNQVNIQLYYAHYEDIFNLDQLDDISGYFSFFNTYEDFDFYNGVVWHRNSVDWENYFDWTSSITWNVSEELTVTLKGDNLLNKAKETSLYRLDLTTQQPITPLSISPIDQRITIELEYMF